MPPFAICGILAHLLRPDLTELPQTLADQGLELVVVEQAVEVLELLPAQLQLLNPQSRHAARQQLLEAAVASVAAV